MRDFDNSVLTGQTQATFRIDKENWRIFSKIGYDMYGHGGVTRILNKFVNDYIIKYQGKSNKLDTFFDPDFIPKPEIDSLVEEKTLPWLRVQPVEKLKIQGPLSYRTFIYCNALIDTPPSERRTIHFNFDTIWKRYR